jgi:hypothetical protein
MSRADVLPRFQADYDAGYRQGVKMCFGATPAQIAEYVKNLKSWGYGINTERGAFVAGWLQAVVEQEAA